MKKASISSVRYNKSDPPCHDPGNVLGIIEAAVLVALELEVEPGEHRLQPRQLLVAAPRHARREPVEVSEPLPE